MRYDKAGGSEFVPFSFEVCGVLKSKDDAFGFSRGGTFYIPRSFITEEMGADRDADDAEVELYHSADIDAATQHIEAFSDAFAKKPHSVWLFSQKSMLDEINQVLL
ncbi:MAG: macrolide ABC transporter permease, partial [Treponema phagedenis]